MSEPTQGYCRLCGTHGQLTDEHLIPESAGNDSSVQLHTFQSISEQRKTGVTWRKGLTRRTLCKRCNERGGQYYVSAFRAWTRQARSLHAQAAHEKCVLHPFTADFLSVVKQIALMAVAMSETASIHWGHYPQLRRFCFLPKMSGGLPDFRFFVYLHFGQAVREGVFHMIDTKGGPAPGCSVR